MNIFILDFEPITAAEYHVDRHVVKMPLETAQILCAVRYKYNIPAPYKPTHLNHPCVLWAAESADNYRWLVDLGEALCAEYSYRYNKIHKCREIIRNVQSADFLPSLGLTSFAQAMPDDVKQQFNVVAAYRDYYNKYKRHLFSWTNRNIPYWIKEI